MSECKITGIYSYPVKSCRASSMESAEISPTGIEGDRQLMLLYNGKFTNQAFIANLAKVETQRLGPLSIRFGNQENSLDHQISDQGEEHLVDFYGNQVAVLDQGDVASDWVSNIAGKEVRVVALKETFKRQVPLEEFAVVHDKDQSRFVDVAPILVTNEASLADLNARLQSPVPMNRFRPNIVIEGLDAFAEDQVIELQGATISLVRATHCERCAVTCTDQETGARASEPLSTLKAYRHREGGYAGGVMFGAYMAVNGQGTIRVGDTFTVK
ncbi:MAG: MOSC domain-containing protein [Pseudomonadota bacterium]